MTSLSRRHHRARMVRDALHAAVVEGVWVGALPHEDELGRQFGVGRNVVREALRLLVEEGLLVRQQGWGTRPTTSVLMHAMHRLQSLHEDAGLTTSSRDIQHRVVRWDLIPASPLHAAALGVATGETVVHYERLTSSLTPLIFWSTVMRSDVGLRPPAPVGGCSALGFYAYLERSGLTLGQESVRTSAVRADQGVAELLDVEPGSPLLVQHRRLLMADGRPLEVSTGYLRPDQVALTHDISR